MQLRALVLMCSLNGCGGSEQSRVEPDASRSGGDAAQVDAGRPDSQVFAFPNGEPGVMSLYFRATCVSGDCDYAPYDEWFTGTLTKCAYDGTQLELETGPITNGATSFLLRFALGSGPTFELDPATTEADWSLPDGASAFLWMSYPQIETKSSGAISFARCGDEVAGRFDLHDLCEYHGCSSAPWIADVAGAFKCAPRFPLSCGL